MDVACSLGLVDEEQAGRLADAGVVRYNHNLEAARSYFGRIVSTHTWEERYATCQTVRRAGLELCSGGIIGLGETWEQRVELAYDLASLDPDEVPLNFLNPRPGTPLAGADLVEPMEALKAIALFRLVLPRATLRYAGGREVTLRELQALGLLGGINALIVGNYLTTLGRTADEDLDLLADLRMPLRRLTETL
jgi:biotin synthase